MHMPIDISGPLYSALDKAINEYHIAKQKKDIPKSQEKARECANLLRNIARVTSRSEANFS